MQNIIERYLYAVTRHLKESQRESVKKELNSLIEDMLKARTNGREAKEEDIYVVLEELGKPYELAQQYGDADKKGFLNNEYLRAYKGVLCTVLPIVVILYVLGAYTSNIVTHGNWLESLSSCIEVAIISLCVSFTLITVIFALLQYSNISIRKENIRNLPQIPNKNGKAGSYVTLIVMFILGITLLVNPSMIFAAVVNWERVSIFNETRIHELSILIIVFLLVVLLREGYVLIMKGSGLKSMGVALLLDLIETGLVFGLFLRADIVNADFIQLFEERFPGKGVIVDMFANTNYWIAGLFLIFIIFRNLRNIKNNND